MQVFDDMEVAQPRVCDFAFHQPARDNAGDATSCGKRRVGDSANETDAAAAIDDFNTALGKVASCGARGVDVCRTIAGT